MWFSNPYMPQAESNETPAKTQRISETKQTNRQTNKQTRLIFSISKEVFASLALFLTSCWAFGGFSCKEMQRAFLGFSPSTKAQSKISRNEMAERTKQDFWLFFFRSHCWSFCRVFHSPPVSPLFGSCRSSVLFSDRFSPSWRDFPCWINSTDSSDSSRRMKPTWAVRHSRL